MSLTRSYQHSSFDLLLAGVETVVTFSLAYPAAVSLGAVLLQTAPARGLPGQRMEAFLRVMREVRQYYTDLTLAFVHPASTIARASSESSTPPGTSLLAAVGSLCTSRVYTLDDSVGRASTVSGSDTGTARPTRSF